MNQSLPAPSSHPLILIDFKKVYGYYPSNHDEADDMKHQVCRDIFGSDAVMTESEPSAIISLVTGNASSTFIPRTCELFQMGIATHIDSGIDQNKAIHNTNTVIISYPENIHIQEDPIQVLNTAQIWNEIIQGQDRKSVV